MDEFFFKGAWEMGDEGSQWMWMASVNGSLIIR